MTFAGTLPVKFIPNCQYKARPVELAKVKDTLETRQPDPVEDEVWMNHRIHKLRLREKFKEQ